MKSIRTILTMMVLVALCSCGEKKQAAQYIVGIEKYDYGFFFNNLKQNVADRIKAFIEK